MSYLTGGRSDCTGLGGASLAGDRAPSPTGLRGLSAQRQTCREAGKVSARRREVARALRASPERGARWDSGKRAWNSD